jgi:hypothetical protein
LAALVYAIFICAIVTSVNAVTRNKLKAEFDFSIIPPNLITILEPVAVSNRITVSRSSIQIKPLTDWTPTLPMADIICVHGVKLTTQGLTPHEQVFRSWSDESLHLGYLAFKIDLFIDIVEVAVIPNCQIDSRCKPAVPPRIFPFYQNISFNFLNLPVNVFKVNIGTRSQLGFGQLASSQPSLPSGNAGVKYYDDNTGQSHPKHGRVVGPFCLALGMLILGLGWLRLWQCSGYWPDDKRRIFFGIPCAFTGGALMIWGWFHFLISIS